MWLFVAVTEVHYWMFGFPSCRVTYVVTDVTGGIQEEKAETEAKDLAASTAFCVISRSGQDSLACYCQKSC